MLIIIGVIGISIWFFWPRNTDKWGEKIEIKKKRMEAMNLYEIACDDNLDIEDDEMAKEAFKMAAQVNIMQSKYNQKYKK